MKLHVSSLTTFHALNLAQEMARLGHLGKFYTGLPASMTPGLLVEQVCRQPLLLAPQYLAGLLHASWLQRVSNWPVTEAFDRWLAAQVEPCDVFHCLSGMGLRAHRAAKRKYHALTVCDRGSTHIRYQDQVCRAEYQRWDLDYVGTDTRFIEKEEAEYAECDLITVPSQFARRTFVAAGLPSAKIAVVPYGVDLREFHPVEKQDQVFRVLYVGQLTPRKGLPYLLEAVAELPLPNFEVWLIGSLDHQVDRFLEKYRGHFKYLGVKPRAELFRYYSQASLFVLPSLEEGLSLVMAQAMACGLPVVATVNSGAEDLFFDGTEGFIIPAGDAAAIRDKILYLYENPKAREQMAAAALQAVQRLGGWQAYGDRAAQIYAEALLCLYEQN